jgi:hypothetical protein
MNLTLMRTARVFSQRAPVLVACWHQLEMDGPSACLRPPFLEFEHGEYRVWSPKAPVEVGPLWHFPVSSQHVAPLTAEEADAEHRLTAAGIRCDGVPPDTTARALYALAQRGTPTNAAGVLGRLGRKDWLEHGLRWYEETTGKRLPRPRTSLCTGAQLDAALASFGDRDCIVKPANSRGGRGIRLVPAGRAAGDGVDPHARFVVQELVRNPLIVAGAKADLRCYLLVVARSRHRSRRVGPVFARASSIPYQRLVPEAEITNTSLRRRLGLGPSIQPLALALADDPARCAVIGREVERLCASLLDFAFAWRDEYVAGPAAAQVMLWGIDLLVSGPPPAATVCLLEVNVYPQLHRGDPACDGLVDEMLVADYLPELVVAARPGLTEAGG